MLIFMQDQTRYWEHFGAVLTFSTAPPGQFPDPPHPAASGGPSGLGRAPPVIRHRRSNRWRDDGSSSSTSAKASIRREALASRLFPAALRKSVADSSNRVISMPAIMAPMFPGPWIHRSARLGIPRALLHKSADGRTAPSPGQTYPTTFVTGMPSAV